MAVTFTIASVDRTSVIDLTSLQVSLSLTGAWTATLHTLDRLSTIAAYRPALHDDVVIADGATTLLTGIVVGVEDQPIAAPHIGTRTIVRVSGAGGILDRILVTEHLVKGPWPILNSSIANPTSLTVVAHGFVTGQRVFIEDHQGSTPAIAGEYVATVTGPNNFTIPVNVSVAGGGGTVRRVMTLEEIVDYLHTTYLTGTGITLDAGNPTGPTLEPPVFDGVTVRAALAYLQTLTGYVIRVTPDLVLQFFTPGTETAAYALTAANRLNVGPVTWTKDIGQYANRVVLQYGSEVQTRKSESFTGTGAINSWDLSYDPVTDANQAIVSAGYVTDNGSFLPLGILIDIATSSVANPSVITTSQPHGFTTGDSVVIQGHVGSTPDINATHTITSTGTHTFTIPVNVTGGGTGGTCYRSALTWHWYAATNTLYRVGNLTAGHVATFAYDVQYPQTVTVEDAAEIALYGAWETRRSVTTIFEAVAATDWATALLRRLMDQGMMQVTTQTRQGLVLPGDTITLTFTDRGVSGSHLLTDVKITADRDKTLRYTLTAVSGTESPSGWMDLLRESLGGGGGSASGGGVISGAITPPTSGGGTPSAGTGTIGTLAKFVTTTSVGDSLVTESGSTVTVAGTLSATTAVASPLFSATADLIVQPGTGNLILKPQSALKAVRLWARTGDGLGAYQVYDSTGATFVCHFYGDANDGSMQIASVSNCTIAPGGDLIFDPGGNDVLPATNYDLNLGAINRKYLTLHAAELWVETLVAQNTIATIGGRVLVTPTNILTADLGDGVGDTTITLKYNSFAADQILYMEADGKVEFFRTTSGASGTGPYTYTVTRNLDNSGRNLWYAGDAIVYTGSAPSGGNVFGFIDLYSLSGIGSVGTGPTIVGNVRNSLTYNDWSPAWAIGNLNGLYGYSVHNMGVGLGDPAAANLVIDATNGIRIRYGTTVYALLAASTFRIGASGGNRLEWDNSTLTVVSAQLTIDSNGIRIAAPPSSYTDVYSFRYTASGSIAGASFGFYAQEPDSVSRYIALRNIITSNDKTSWISLISQAARSAGGNTTCGVSCSSNASTNVGAVIISGSSVTIGDASSSTGVLGNLDVDGKTTVEYMQFNEQSSNPSNPGQDIQANVYVKGDKFVIAFNSGGTMKYFTLDLSGVAAAWFYSTSAP